MNRFEVLEAAYHRNGVGGAGFYVGIVCDRVEGRRMLVTWFPEQDQETGEPHNGYQQYVSVVDLDQAVRGNVYMHPTGDHPGDNAWRGADEYIDAARAIKAAVDERFARDQAGYATQDTPSEPRRSAYTDDSVGQGAYLGALRKWSTYTALAPEVSS